MSDLGAYIEEITGESPGDLPDVTIGAIGVSEIPAWNETAWINRTLTPAGIASANHSHIIADVSGSKFALDVKRQAYTPTSQAT